MFSSKFFPKDHEHANLTKEQGPKLSAGHVICFDPFFWIY